VISCFIFKDFTFIYRGEVPLNYVPRFFTLRNGKKTAGAEYYLSSLPKKDSYRGFAERA